MASASALLHPEDAAPPAGWSFTKVVSWYTIAVVLLALRGPVFVAAFAPPGEFVGDFGQDWASARNHRAGLPVYDGTRDAYRRHIGPDTRTDDLLPRNAHPPGSVLFVLPLAPLSYPDAHLAWNLATFPLFLLAAALVVRELGVTGWLPALLPAIAFGAVCDPLLMQLMVGNFGCLLAFLLAAAWVGDRRGRVGLAGSLVGVAAGVKMFPAFLLVYFVATRRWKGVAGFALGFAGVNAIALALFGFTAFRTYFLEVAPAVAAENVSSWLNASLAGFWMRLFAPTANHGVLALSDAPQLGRALTLLSQLVVTGIVGLVAWRSRTAAARDRAFALASVGMLLVCPLAWPHTFLLLLVPVAHLLYRLPAGPWRWALVACLVVLWLPANYVAQLVLGPHQAALMLTDRHAPLTPAQNLATVSVTTYALVGLFGLALWHRGVRVGDAA
jgi:alpha-1,2-mannosyltransferase